MNFKRSYKDIFIISTTESDQEKAKYLADKILSNKLVACVNFIDIKSSYWWDGNIENSNEVKLLIKTTKMKLEETLVMLRSFHSYKTPEIIFWSVSVNNSYVVWFVSEII